MHTQQTPTGMRLVSPSCEARLAPPYAFKQLPANYAKGAGEAFLTVVA